MNLVRYNPVLLLLILTIVTIVTDIFTFMFTLDLNSQR
jgi:hypothetical protein